MNRTQRIAQQRVLAREAITKLRCIEGLFGVDDQTIGDSFADWEAFATKRSELERWIFEESPIA